MESRAGGDARRAANPRRRDGAYERVLGDAMEGDATLFAREDYVEEAWRIVDPVLKSRHTGLRVRAAYVGADRGRSERCSPPEAGTTRRCQARRLALFSRYPAYTGLRGQLLMDTIDAKSQSGMSRRDLLRIVGGVAAANGLGAAMWGALELMVPCGCCRNLAQVGLSLLRDRLRCADRDA